MTRSKWLAGAIALGMFVCCGSAMAQDKKPEGKPADKPAAAKPDQKKDANAGGQEGGTPPGMSAEEAEQMQLMMAAGTPSEEHKALIAHFVGTWDVETKMLHNPAAPETSKATAKATEILGGRFVSEEFDGDMMGMPFKGISMAGYDRINKQYVSIWMDSMSTNIFMSTGTFDPSKKAYTYKTEMHMPTKDGKVNKMPVRFVITLVDKDKHTFEWFENKGGKEEKTMEMTYTRRKAS